MRNTDTRTLIDAPCPAGAVRNPEDWSAAAGKAVVHHGPSKTTFQIMVDLNGLDETLALEDFCAELVHFCGGTRFPTCDELELLRAEAILMSLSYTGLVTFLPEDGDGDIDEGRSANIVVNQRDIVEFRVHKPAE